MPLVPTRSICRGGKQPTGVSRDWYLDGAAVSFLNFGRSTFTWDPSTNVVHEVPIYCADVDRRRWRAARRRAFPRFSAGAARRPAWRPRGGAAQLLGLLARSHVVVPPTARVFAQPGAG